MATISDAIHERRRGKALTLNVENVCSFRCRDCAKLRYVTRRELGRASRPRCLMCGGTLIETDTSHKREVKRRDAAELAGRS